MQVVDVDEGLATAYISLFKLKVIPGKRELVESQGTKDALASSIRPTLDLPPRLLTNKIKSAVCVGQLDVSCRMTHRSVVELSFTSTTSSVGFISSSLMLSPISPNYFNSQLSKFEIYGSDF
jgi:hypothetical protein